jgi:hypothetical protein
MTTRTTTLRKIGFVIAFAVSVLSMSTASHAYTAEEQRLCMSDAFKFCSSEIPNIEKVTACLQKNKAQLSPGCLSVRK